MSYATQSAPAFARRGAGAIFLCLAIVSSGGIWLGLVPGYPEPVLLLSLIPVFLALMGLACLIGRRSRWRAPPPVAVGKQAGGRMLLSYMIASFLVLRLYGVAFIGIAYGLTTGSLRVPPHYSPLDVDPVYLATFAGVIGISLLVPVLTPRLLDRPRSVSAGFLKAVMLLALTAPIYFAGLSILESGAVKHGREYLDILPVLIKSIAGLSVTGAILVSMATQLTLSEETREPDMVKPSDDALRQLRRDRMNAL